MNFHCSQNLLYPRVKRYMYVIVNCHYYVDQCPVIPVGNSKFAICIPNLVLCHPLPAL